MKTIAYMKDGNFVTATFTDENYFIDFEHIVVTAPLPEPTDACFIEDGEIKLDSEKAKEIIRNTLPPLSKRDFRKLLRDVGLFQAAEAYVRSSGDGYLEDAWDYADYFVRTDPFIVQAATALELSDELVDYIWINGKLPEPSEE